MLPNVQIVSSFSFFTNLLHFPSLYSLIPIPASVESVFIENHIEKVREKIREKVIEQVIGKVRDIIKKKAYLLICF